jgi:uncharacterized protein (TIGR02217 family)
MTTTTFPTRWIISASDSSGDPDVFPFLTGQTFLQLKTPVWSTKVDTSVSGVERRRALWSYPVYKFKVAYEVLRDDPNNLELTRLFAFFNTHQGSFREFFYYDHTDNTAIGQPFGTGDGVTTTFQITRTTGVGAVTFTEPVRGFSGTPQVFVNGVATTAFTIGALGLITFATAPAAGAVLTWTGQFFFLCRFMKDEIDAQQMFASMWSNSGLEFMSVKN